MEVIRINPHEDRTEFLDVPAALFPNNPLLAGAPESVFEDHLSSLFILKDGEQLLGRLALYQNPGHQYEGKPACAVGYFHCVQDPKAAQLLLNAAEEKARELGAGYLIGPLNGSTWESYRFRTTDEPPTFFLESPDPAYYNELFREAGFTPIQDYYSFLKRKFSPLTEREQQRGVALEEMGVSYRTIDPERYEADMRNIHQLCLSSFQKNFLYTPYPFERFIAKYRLLQPFAQPHMTLLAEHQGELVGFVFMIDDVFCTTEKRFVFKTFAVHPARQYAGLGTVMAQRLLDRLLAEGYESSIYAYVIGGGQSYNYGTRETEIYRTYLLYAKAINN